MNSLSVIVPSKTASNLLPCIEAVRRHEPAAEIIAVDDGLAFTSEESARFSCVGAVVMRGIKPFGFSRNCNLAINASGDSDVVLLNDDAILETTGGFSLLQKTAEENPEFGIISATTNVAGNPEQFRRGAGLREATRSIAFVAIFIPRRTIKKVGLMDERFGGLTPDGRVIYGFCDNDMTRRVRGAGLKVGILDGVFVDHGSLVSSFRGDPHAAADISAGRELYLAKWGDLN